MVVSWWSLKRFGGLVALVVLAGAVAAAGASGRARSRSAPGPRASEPVRQIATVSFPKPYKNPTSDDIGWVDPQTQTYYLADRTNNAVDAVNARTNSFEAAIGAGTFAGEGSAATPAQTAACGAHAVSGPDGVLTLRVGRVNQLWAGDGVTAKSTTSSVKVFDLTTPSSARPATSISTNGTCRADELAYDPVDRVVMIANDADTPPYVSFISVNPDPSRDRVLGTIKLPRAIDGIEQPAWDPVGDRFYLSVPQVPTGNGSWLGEVEMISPRTRAIVKSYRAPRCSPAGLAIDPSKQQMLVGCSGDAIAGDTVHGVDYRPNPAVTYIMSARTGRVVRAIHQVGGSDEVWFDRFSDRYYLGASAMTSNGRSSGYPTGVLGVISANTGRWLGNFPTSADAHSVAADPHSGHVFVPIANYGIAVFKGG